jgi:hypothetical protein
MAEQVSEIIGVGDFVRNRLRDWQVMAKASRDIDEFRKKYGRVEKDFNSVEIIRKMRDCRQ